MKIEKEPDRTGTASGKGQKHGSSKLISLASGIAALDGRMYN
jgi:hypothetical protein